MTVLLRNLEIKTRFDALAPELQKDLDARARRRVFAEGRGPDTVEEAYALQRALRSFREARGEHVVGFKIGYTSKAVRRNLVKIMGLKESVHGYLWDTERFNNNAIVDHRRLAIEGELGVTLLATDSRDVAEWEVEFEPIIETHMLGMDGPPEDDLGRRGMELIGTNCFHTGVVHCSETKRCLVGEIPLNEPMRVDIDRARIEEVTLTELEVGGVYGPAATISWLLRKLEEEGNGEERLLCAGTSLICSTPGALHPVARGGKVKVEFSGLEVFCSASD
ncbi:MAG: hypothetical protein CMQ22_07955 [Gammaproteobacteria bacterium]|nr:hypothetical protein [Gammaproteobacteria bacterium]